MADIVRLFKAHVVSRYYDPLSSEADSEAVAGVGVMRTGEPEADGASSVAGNIKVVATTTDRTVAFFCHQQLLMSAFGVEVIDDVVGSPRGGLQLSGVFEPGQYQIALVLKARFLFRLEEGRGHGGGGG